MIFIKKFLIETVFVLFGSIVSLFYIIMPSPFLMTVFLFIVQPMFVFVITKTVLRIYKDLKTSKVL